MIYADDLGTAIQLIPEKCKRSDAQWAVCACGALLQGGPTWSVLSSLWLHSHGSCPKPGYTYYRIST